jgi:hypothetical protein
MGIKLTPNDSLRDHLEHQLRIAQQLENFVATTTTGPQKSDTVDPRKASIFMALADKSFTTFHSIAILSKAGLYEDAASLVRILYESTMTAAFLLYADEQQVDDYADYFMYRNWRDHQLAEEVNPIAASALPPDVLKEMRAQFNHVEGRYGKGRWTTCLAETMAKVADTNLPDGFKVFTVLYASIYRQCSAYVHSDVRSIQSRIRQTPDGVVNIRRGISEESCGRLMYAANFLMLKTCFMVSGTFYGGKYIPQWNALVLRWNGTADTDSPDPDPDYTAIERRIEVFIAMAGALMTVIAAARWGLRAAEGVAIGTAVCWVNFRWLRVGAASLIKLGLAQAGVENVYVPRSTHAKFMARLLLLVFIAYVILAWLRLPVMAVISGLAAVVPAIVLELGYEVTHGHHRWRAQ